MMMEKRHRCKLCLRSFGNGRALGGHMRSHMMKFYASKQVKHAFDSVDEFDVVHDSYSSSSDDDDEESALLVDHGFGSESDPICRRSNRVRKSRVSDLEDGFFHVDKKLKFGYLSSVSDTTSEEHLAHCLIMLSRDTWRREDEEEEEEYSGAVVKTKVGRGKYRCEECNKLFRSYQALGGHRASHKKIKLNTPPPPSPPRKVSGSPPEKKVHECPFCERVFSSGQALGGHKRTHFIAAATTAAAAAASKQSPVIREKLKIDLNLPAPVDEDEDDVSQIAVSAVSDEEFVRPIMR